MKKFQVTEYMHNVVLYYIVFYFITYLLFS